MRVKWIVLIGLVLVNLALSAQETPQEAPKPAPKPAPTVQLTPAEQEARMTANFADTKKKVRESPFGKACQKAGGEVRTYIDGATFKPTVACEL